MDMFTNKEIMQNKKFVRYKDGCKLYSMSLRQFEKIAKDAGAIYKVNKMVLINTKIIDEYLEMYHVL